MDSVQRKDHVDVFDKTGLSKFTELWDMTISLAFDL